MLFEPIKCWKNY